MSVPSVSENKNVEQVQGTEKGQSKTQDAKILPWLLPAIVLQDVPGCGKGLIATEFIPEGTVVWRDAEGREAFRFTDEEARKWPKEEYDDWCFYCYQVEDNLFSATRVRKGEKRGEEPSEFTNHSCDPNIWQEIDDDFVMTARRDIKKGEHVTYDYCTSETENSKQVGFAWKCRCGSRVCRGGLSGQEYKDPTLQKLYERRWSPYIQTKIDKLKGVTSTPQRTSSSSPALENSVTSSIPSTPLSESNSPTSPSP